MFNDEWQRFPTCLHCWLSWDRYVLLTAVWTCWSVAIGAASVHSQHSPLLPAALLTSAIPSCDDATDLAQWLVSIGCLHLFSLALLTSLRDRRHSLQLRVVFACKALQAALLLLSILACLALTSVLAHSLSSYSPSSSPLCPPSPSSFLYLTSALSVPLSYLTSLTSTLHLLHLIYHRLTFASPPTKPSPTQPPDTITWVRHHPTGLLIPTLLIIPPTTDLSLLHQHTPTFPCSTVLLYAHGNAMDLDDSVYVLRAMAETFDCAVLGFEFAGYGHCQGSASEEGCNAAIEAAYTALTDYHHVQPESIILYGRSLGTGPSTHLAHALHSQLGGVVLQSPMLSVLRAGCPCYGSQRTLPCDMFPTCDLLPSLTLPVFLLHGQRDTVVPFSHALQLQSLLSPQSSFPPMWVADGDHHNMPKPWLHSTEKLAGDSEERYVEKMRVNARNAAYIERVRGFIQHCHSRTAQRRMQAKAAPHTAAAASPTTESPQQAQLDQPSCSPVLLTRPHAEEKVAEPALSSPAAPSPRHAIFNLASEGNGGPVPILTPLSPLSRAESQSAVPHLSIPHASISSPRSLLPFSPSSGAPPALTLPSSVPFFPFHSPHTLSTLPLSDDSPPPHVRTQSATTALRAFSRLTSYPTTHHRPRRSITVNTIASLPDERGGGELGGTAGGVTLERLLDGVGGEEVRFVREGGVGGGWRVVREEGGGQQRRARRRSVSESPQLPSASLDAVVTIAVRDVDGERKEE